MVRSGTRCACLVAALLLAGCFTEDSVPLQDGGQDVAYTSESTGESTSESTSEAAGESPGTRRALLIGIDDYLIERDLAGTVNDVALIHSVLTGKLEYDPANIVVLQDAAATREAIISTFRAHLIEESGPDDHVFFHYSGHGSQMFDTSGDEPDGLDETLVPHDSRTEGVFDISDDELNSLLAELSQRTSNITVVLDSCHSGSGTRGGARVRQVRADTRQPPPSSWARGATAVGTSDFRQMGSNYVLFTGASPFELANETTVNGRVFGIMTYNLATTLREASSATTFKDVIDIVTSKVATAFPTQHPQLEGTAPDRLIFGADSVVPDAYALVTRAGGNRVTVNNGQAQGLQPDQVLSVYAPGTKAFTAGGGTGQIRIDSVDTFEAQGRITSGSVADASRTPVAAFVRGDYVLSVWLAPDADPDGVLAGAIDEDPGLRAVGASEDAQLSVAREDNAWQLRMGDLTPLGTLVADVATVATRLGEWANWYAVLYRGNTQSSAGVSIRVRRDTDPLGALPPGQIEPGDILKYVVRNDSSEPLHITVISLSTSGDIEALYYSGSQRLNPGRELPARRLGTFLPEELDESVDFFKVYAASSPIDPSLFTAASVGARGVRRLSADWLTDTVAVRLKRSSVRATGYVLLLDDATRAVPGARGTARTVCGPGGAACVSAEPLSESGDVLFVSPATRGAPDAGAGTAAAFQGAYDLGRSYDVRRVEPVFDVHVPDEQPQQATTRGGRSDEHDPAAAADPLWSLRYVGALEAREQLRQLGKAPGAEARGVYIAHLDTGYRKHPEIWQEHQGERPVLPEWGVDLVQNDDDPQDDLVTSGLLPNPGHGTGNASVIVSPPGCQLDGADPPCMSGVSPGAQLIPVRVHTSVMVLNQHKLVRAIYAVVDKKIQGDPPLISIAMGGPPSWSLWKAVRAATDAGTAIVAAAGNRIGFVVWPARFDDTIAVAAVNVRCAPWFRTSAGRKVDVSAPGESIWRAGVSERSGTDFIGMSSGTSYSTASATGVAALWLARHAGSDALGQLRATGQLNEVLRTALTATAWHPGSDGQPDDTLCGGVQWNERMHGAGIVNAAALVDRPLNVTAGTRALRSAMRYDDLPLFSSIYGEDMNLSRTRQDYMALFGGAKFDEVARYEVEILFHYSQSRPVRAALDEIAAGGETYATARARLLEQNLSSDLRAALGEAQTTS